MVPAALHLAGRAAEDDAFGGEQPGAGARRRVRDERHGELLEVRLAVVAGEDARHLERLDRARVAHVAAPSHALPRIRRPPLA